MKNTKTIFLLSIFFFLLPIIVEAAIGDRIRVSNPSGLNARFCAGTSCAVVGQHAIGSLGTVIGGPTVANGYTWWQVNYDIGADGWSNGQWLEKVAGDTTPPSTPQELIISEHDGYCSFEESYNGKGTIRTTEVKDCDLYDPGNGSWASVEFTR